LLVTPFFTPAEVQFTVLDVFPKNLQSVHTLIRGLSLEGYFCDVLEADASTYQIPPEKEINIVISETMKSALFKEPQAAITLNLAPQLPADGVFIPGLIEVDLRMVHRRIRNDWRYRLIRPEEVDYTQFETPLGRIITLSASAQKNELLANPVAVFTVPEHFNRNHHQLELHTTINLYNEMTLTRYDASITLPVTLIKHYEHSISAGNKLSFWYELIGVPGLRYLCETSEN
jgi:hypothetical protein